ncbi:sugar phosphate isomerase/epimerase, partial [Photobacterium sp. ZSDE20]|nr:sugar phosphate isomerase/epimerase [Photobacterium sp. ZSDE20]
IPFCRHFHIKDVMNWPRKYTFPAIGKGNINYFEILPHLLSKDIPFSFEIPLRMSRQLDATPSRSENSVPLSEIHSTLKQSIEYFRQSVSDIAEC